MMLDKYQKLNLKNKISASLSVFALIIFGLIYFIVIPTVNDIQVMSNDIEQQRIDLENKYIKGNSLKQLMENLKKIEPKLNLLNRIFINKNRELEFITTLENEANNSQVTQKINLSSPTAVENQGFQKNSLQLYAKGNFNQQLKYLMNLESLSYYINANSLELTPASGMEKTENGNLEPVKAKNEIINLNLFINADTYWQ